MIIFTEKNVKIIKHLRNNYKMHPNYRIKIKINLQPHLTYKSFLNIVYEQ